MALRVEKGTPIPVTAPAPAAPKRVASPKVKAPKKARRGPSFAPSAAAPVAAQPILLAINQTFQEQSQWCWSACTVMVLGLYYPTNPVSQCELAGWLSGNSCCAVPGSSLCNIPCPAEPSSQSDTAYVGGVFIRHFVQCQTYRGPINGDALVNELRSGRPVGLGLRLWNSASHMILVRGYSSDTGYFQVNDPWYGPGSSTFENLVNGYGGGGAWIYTFMNLQRT